jgi:hypothetical protein
MDNYLSNHVRGYSYEKHFGGVFYLFLRGIDLIKGPALAFTTTGRLKKWFGS